MNEDRRWLERFARDFKIWVVNEKLERLYILDIIGYYYYWVGN